METNKWWDNHANVPVYKSTVTFNQPYLRISSNLSFSVNEGAAVTIGGRAFVFNDTESEKNQRGLELDLESYDLCQVGPESPPPLNGKSAAVTDGQFGYIIPGYGWESGNVTSGIFRFNPDTLDNRFIPVSNNGLGKNSFYTIAPGSVFVPIQNRIYFGGRSYDSVLKDFVNHDEIYYVDLNPLNRPHNS